MKARIGVVGVSGYSGLELMRLVLRHPAMECVSVMASETTGQKPLDEIHPQLRNLSRLRTEPVCAERLADLGCGTVFLCTPNEVSHGLAPKLLEEGIRVVDFSGSFRLRDPSLYDLWYGFPHQSPALLNEAVYGLTEWNVSAIRKARLVANPGCYPTSALLALLPLVRAGIVSAGSDIVCDSKSGVTGAGRSAKAELMFSEIAGSFRAYSPLRHRHAPEICQELGWAIDHFDFVPHLLPVNRGILSTIYVTLAEPMSPERISDIYRRCYEGRPFMRLLGSQGLPELRAVNHSNFCDLAWRTACAGERVVLFSAIDNLIKGASGQAVQNFNVMHGLDETLGLLEGGGFASHD
ncbi:MAG: N-acetyl-gamma-glutamyl-phosphate reductase [Acidobacteria bacterium]|nr:N-acetyl-gamma-glutamyl-phosphate reductase [Acidobacteriota bacterium]